MAIEIICSACQQSYFMATDNTTAEYDRKTGAVKIKTKCPLCEEKSKAKAKYLDATTVKEKSATAADLKPGAASFDL